jgi:hypothetical protein
MRKSFQFILFVFVCVTVLSCEKDNYDEPSSQLSGRLMYNGEAIGLERNQVPLELYQYGFGRVAPIRSTFAQDGTYSQLLFNGDYKLIIPNGQGPFMWKQLASGAPDSLSISLNGDQTLDLDVTPFYMIRNAQFTAAGGKVTATFKAEKIITDANAKDIERVELYINKTQFVSRAGEDNLASSDMAGSDIADPNNISLNVTIPTITPTQNYVFARVGIKVAGVEDRIYSQVQRIQF